MRRVARADDRLALRARERGDVSHERGRAAEHLRERAAGVCLWVREAEGAQALEGGAGEARWGRARAQDGREGRRRRRRRGRSRGGVGGDSRGGFAE